jgi:hypothetical protein
VQQGDRTLAAGARWSRGPGSRRVARSTSGCERGAPPSIKWPEPPRIANALHHGVESAISLRPFFYRVRFRVVCAFTSYFGRSSLRRVELDNAGINKRVHKRIYCHHLFRVSPCFHAGGTHELAGLARLEVA